MKYFVSNLIRNGFFSTFAITLKIIKAMQPTIQPFKLLALVFTILFCNSVIADKSDKFIGTWEKIRGNPQHPIIISKSGVNFIVQMPEYDAGDGRYIKDVRTSASYIPEFDKLEVSVHGFKMDIIFDEKMNRLLFWNAEYFKVVNKNETRRLELTTQKAIFDSIIGVHNEYLSSCKRVLDELNKPSEKFQTKEEVLSILRRVEKTEMEFVKNYLKALIKIENELETLKPN